MQYINLLPVEMRPKETTPLKVIVTLYVGVAVNFSLLMWALFVQFGPILQVEKKMESVDAQIGVLDKDARFYDRLQNEIRELERKDKIVNDIIRERVRWGRRLDLVWDVVSSSRTSWVSGIKVGETTQSVKKKGSRAKGTDYRLPTLTLNMFSSNFEDDSKILDMTSEALIAGFIDRYKSNEELIQGFEIVPPEKWSHSDKSWKSHKKMVVKYKLFIRALPYIKEKGERKAIIE